MTAPAGRVECSIRAIRRPPFGGGHADIEPRSRLLPRTRSQIHARRLDVSNEADIASFVEWASGAMGGLNGLINNAGILRDGLLVKKDKESGQVKKLSKEQWDAVIGVNLTGATLLARDVVARMVETNTRPGVVVNISSILRTTSLALAHGCSCPVRFIL